MAVKKYYWLKLKDVFFNQKEIKLIRKQENGDLMAIIYLKLLLLSMKNDGYIFYEKLLDNFNHEIALEIDEDESVVENTLNLLLKYSLIEKDEEDYFLPNYSEMVGSESESAERVRKHRAKKKLQCNYDVTSGNENVTTEKEIEKRDREKIKDKDKELEKDIVAPKVAVFSSDSKEYYLSEYLYNKILENDNKFKKPYLQAWAKDMDKLIRLDNREFMEIKEVIDFATSNDFWKSNILSVSKLRQKYSTLLLQLKNSPENKEKAKREQQYKAINEFLNS